MRKFSSYGPVNPKTEFAVPRSALVERCVSQLVEEGNEPGHYFTIWGPRQTGKTWIMRRAIQEIRARYGDRFTVGHLNLQGTLGPDDTEQVFLRSVPSLLRNGFEVEVPAPQSWDEWIEIFGKSRSIFDRPVILLIDEFDSLPPPIIDRLVALFRKTYLERERYFLHGLALIGVRAVLGVDSPRGSPFNVQRSLQIPNLTRDEVTDLFDQYQRESGQPVDPEVVARVFAVTRGQPGLVSWFGELLTEKYNPGPGKPISTREFEVVYARASQAEWNNTILNLVKKARGPYREQVVSLFTNPNVPFSLDKDWCNYLFMNGIIDEAPAPDDPLGLRTVCRFSCPYVQLRLFAALTGDMFGDRGPILAIEVGDLLSDVFTPEGFAVPPLVERYRGYLKRLAARGIDPWRDQPRRADLHLTEAVGHFHLYAWLLDAVGRRCVISPEFPTGNGKVDLVLRTRDGHVGLVEVKSFVDMYELGEGLAQAAGYAKKLGVPEVTLAVFVPMQDDTIPAEVSRGAEIDGVKVIVKALGWA